MPSGTKSRIIVLHLTKYSDSSAVVHTIDSLCGRKSYFVRGLRSGRHSVSAFHPLNVLDVVSSDSTHSSMSYLREWTPAFPLESIRSNIYKSTVAMFISEVLFRSQTEQDMDGSLLQWLCGAIARLEAEKGSVANFHLWFLTAYCAKMGFRPSEKVEPQGIFNPFEENLLHKLMNMPFEDAMLLEMSASSRNEFSRKMLKYLSFHSGTEIQARSIDVLHEVFS